MSKIIVVVPCYNEAERWNAGAFRRVLSDPAFELLLVDDGSRDATAERMAALASETPQRVRVLPLSRNRGKAEAVRQGLLAALDAGAEMVGYADSDFATPPEELHRMAGHLSRAPGPVIGVLGCRVLRLGGWIDRRPVRHYLGRFFAAWASILLKLPVYDTQCGAKMFRAGALLRAALQEPFRGKWTFDVELIHRLAPKGSYDARRQVTPLIELPLEQWKDVAGSKLSWMSLPGIFLELIGLWWGLCYTAADASVDRKT
jgi:dolichyl-phosphate beta-glucosyltransferase